MNPLRLRRPATAIVLAAAAACAAAQDATPPSVAALRARSLAATCAACHGSDGRAAAGSSIPGLAGMPAPYLAEQMKAFKSGTRTGSVMPQLAKGYSDAQIEQLAAWFAKVGVK